MNIAVITKVPPLPELSEDCTRHGNMASPIVYGLPPDVSFYVLTQGRMPVFELGEILVIDNYGREIGGNRRKPGKWAVDVEYFDNVESAVARSRTLTEES